jgi:hypothetical protein
MPIDWILGLLGGLMIGTAAALFLLGNGRIMGASGILGGLLDGSGKQDSGERLWFLGGLIGVPAIVAALTGGALSTHATSNAALLIGAGLLVGIGTRLANGCTSGHGVCGMSRLSPRALVATAMYVLAGMVTVAILRHGLGVL